jgi:hypothetical protein
MKKSIFLFCCIFFLAGLRLSGQELSLGPEDFRFEQRGDNGFHLFIRKKGAVSSVLLTESTRDPAMRADNFAYRAPEWNPINGDEIRLLNGVPIPRESRIYSLIASATEQHPELGEAFHIFVPWVVNYGYEDGRHGEVLMTNGTYINVRTFSFPYADYRGSFADNPFVLQGVQRPAEELAEEQMEEAEKAFVEIAGKANGDFIYASDPQDLIDIIENLLKREEDKNIDIVICLDTTGSMGRYIDSLRRMLIPMMRKTLSAAADWRIGMVLYRDYPPDAYITKIIPFTNDFSFFQRNLNAIVTWGGGDVPEAVYEALYDGADKFPWAAESRLLILAGDAAPHPVPKGEISQETALQKIAGKGLKLSAILLPR